MTHRLFFAFAICALSPVITAQRVTEAAEPNATVATATVMLCGQEAVGTLSSSSDEDWFRIIIGAPTDLRVRTGPSFSNQIGDTVVTLLDGTGGPLRCNDDAVGGGAYSDLFAKGLAAGVYFVAVTAGVNAASSGDYLLDVRCEPATTIVVPATVNEGAENNNPLTGGTATSVLVPVRCNGDLSSTGAAGDWDFWRVLAFGDNVLRMRVAGTANHSNTPADDLVVYLFDGMTPPNLVAGPFYASDAGEWDLAVDAPIAGGLHHVAVRGVAGSQPGSYYLDLQVRAPAAATVFAGGCGGRTLGLPMTTMSAATVESPTLGTTYSLEGSNLGNTGFAFHVIGLAATSIDLTPFGAVGCTLEVSYVDTVFQFADVAGRATWTLFVPDNISLLGTTVHSQAAVLDLSNPLGITISNRVAATVGH